MKTFRCLLPSIALGIVGASTPLGPAQAGTLPVAPLQDAASREVVFRVRGMSCERCSTTLDDTLRRVDGVLQVDVSLDRGRAWVRYDPRRVARSRLEEVIRDSGYEVELESET